jgi:integron integrase
VPERLPVVLSRAEVAALLGELSGDVGLQARLLYGCGIRLMECLRLRIQDLRFERHEIVVRGGKGNQDRITLLPPELRPSLREQVEEARRIHQADGRAGFGRVGLPHALARQYPNGDRELASQYLFPASQRSTDPASGVVMRHHADEWALQRAVRKAAASAGIDRPVTCHTLRHCFATRLLEDGYDIRTVQELLGHSDVATTPICTHVLNRGPRGVRSPLAEVQALGRKRRG